MSNKIKSCQGKDIFSRMNFLYQASTLMTGKNDVLSAYYGNLCKTIGKRAVLRLDPKIKRTLCKRCGISLKPNITGDLDFIENHSNSMQLICKKCGTIRKYFINSNYDFWLENSNCVVETYKFNKNLEEKEICNSDSTQNNDNKLKKTNETNS